MADEISDKNKNIQNNYLNNKIYNADLKTEDNFDDYFSWEEYHNKNPFAMTLKYLSKIRAYIIINFMMIDTEENILTFDLIKKDNKVRKQFWIYFYDETSTLTEAEQNCPLGRPQYYKYHLDFTQHNVPTRDMLTDLVESKWYRDEEDLLDRIKYLVNHWHY